MSNVLPEYHGGSLLNLIASIIDARGGTPCHPLLGLLPRDSITAPRNLVFLLIDGLGYNYLTDVGRGGALHDHLAGRLTSVFPSTTASAITTSFTGLSPQEHGLTGWFSWFPEAQVVAAALPFRRRGDDVPLDDLGVEPRQLLVPGSLFDVIEARSIVVSQRRIVDSRYSRHYGSCAARIGYDDLAGMVDAIVAAVRSGSERKYVYAYYPEFDAVAHNHGVASRQAANRLRAIDAAFAQLLQRLAGSDTALLMSADHGFIDTAPREALELTSFPQLAALLRLPLTGEPRVAFCHVVPGAVDLFLTQAEEALGDFADVRPSADIVAAGWFGPGDAHPRLMDRVGDVTLIMRGHHTLKDRLPGERHHPMIGHHGGSTADEMYVPLVLARL